MKFKELRQSLTLSEASEKEVKTLKVGKKSKAVIKQKGYKFSVYIDGTLLDDKYKNAKEAEKAAKEFADLMGA